MYRKRSAKTTKRTSPKQVTEDVLVVSVGRFEKRRYVTIDSESDKIPSAH